MKDIPGFIPLTFIPLTFFMGPRAAGLTEEILMGYLVRHKRNYVRGMIVRGMKNFPWVFFSQLKNEFYDA